MLLLSQQTEIAELERRAQLLESQLQHLGKQKHQTANSSQAAKRQRPKSSVPDTSTIKKKLKILKNGGATEEEAARESVQEY